MKTAKIAAEKRVMELEIEAEALQGEVTSLTEDVQESRRTLEYRVSECREAVRQELGSKGVRHRKIATQEDCHRKVAVNFDLALFGQWRYHAPVELVR